MAVLKIGLLGYGTVSSGFYKQLEKVSEKIERQTGIKPVVTRILVKAGERQTLPQEVQHIATEQPEVLLKDSEIQVVIEAINGDEPAASFLEEALLQGKQVITANKAAVARHWERLYGASKAGGARLYLEASVCAGIPLIQVIETISKSDNVIQVEGILNGTSNYILTAMAQQGLSYAEALQKAQQLGYAEADPAADVDGWDAANKLSILCGLAFNTPIHPEQLSRASLRDLSQVKPGLKLVASAVKTDNGLKAGVALEQLHSAHPLYCVDGVENGVVITTEGLGTIRLYGPGAGSEPTGTAMVSDLYRLIETLV